MICLAVCWLFNCYIDGRLFKRLAHPLMGRYVFLKRHVIREVTGHEEISTVWQKLPPFNKMFTDKTH